MQPSPYHHPIPIPQPQYLTPFPSDAAYPIPVARSLPRGSVLNSNLVVPHLGSSRSDVGYTHRRSASSTAGGLSPNVYPVGRPRTTSDVRSAPLEYRYDVGGGAAGSGHSSSHHTHHHGHPGERPRTTSSHSRSRSRGPSPARGISPSRYPRYKFHVAASWAGKPGNRGGTYPANTVIGAWVLDTLKRYSSSPHRAEEPGEDFFFINHLPHDAGMAIGVADGVGGWINKGVDSAVFSQALMYYCAKVFLGEIVKDSVFGGRSRPSPRDCLKLAYEVMLTDSFVKAGSATACLMSLDSQSGLLKAVNLGDSGFLVIRSRSVVFQTRPQFHAFNHPKQLLKNDRSSNSKSTDSPRDADNYEIQLRDKDIIVAYSDGLVDNVYPDEIVDICTVVMHENRPGRDQARVMADRIMDYASQCMRSTSILTPFEREAIKQGVSHRGGKMDDVTVVVTLVER